MGQDREREGGQSNGFGDKMIELVGRAGSRWIPGEDGLWLVALRRLTASTSGRVWWSRKTISIPSSRSEGDLGLTVRPGHPSLPSPSSALPRSPRSTLPRSPCTHVDCDLLPLPGLLESGPVVEAPGAGEDGRPSTDNLPERRRRSQLLGNVHLLAEGSNKLGLVHNKVRSGYRRSSDKQGGVRKER